MQIGLPKWWICLEVGHVLRPLGFQFAVFLSVAPAQAQTLTSDGLQCGSVTVPLDTFHGATLGAKDARIKDLNNLYSYSRAALNACSSDIGDPDLRRLATKILNDKPFTSAIEQMSLSMKAAEESPADPDMLERARLRTRTAAARYNVLVGHGCEGSSGDERDRCAAAIQPAWKFSVRVPYPTDSRSGVAGIAQLKTLVDQLLSIRRSFADVSPSKLPGCRFVMSTTEKLRHLYHGGDVKRLDVATAVQLRAESVRVLAHQACETGATNRTQAFDSACSELVSAEEAAAHYIPEQSDRLTALRKFRDNSVEFQVPNREVLIKAITQQPTGGGGKTELKDQVLQKALDTRDTCRADGSQCKPDASLQATAIDAVRALNNVQAFYAAVANVTVELSSPAIRLRADSVKFGTPPMLRLQDDQLIPNDSLGNYFAATFRRVDSNGKSCINAEFYVSPSGALVHNATRQNTVCIDSSMYSIDRPFEVEITEYPIGPDVKHAPVYSQMVTAWPGELTPLSKALHTAVARITVRGYPSGTSLRTLAFKGTEPLSTAPNVSDLLREQRSTSAAQEVYDSQVDASAALSRLAIVIGNDKDFTSAVSKMQADIASAAAGGDASAFVNARSSTDAASKLARNLVMKFAADASSESAVAASRAVNIVQALLVSVPPVAATPPAGTPDKNAAAGDSLSSGAAGMQKLQELAGKIAGFAGAISLKVADSQSQINTLAQGLKDKTKTLERLCRLSTALLPVVDEDVLLDENKRGIFVLDYDFDAGFQRSTPRRLMDTDQIFVRVRHVLPGGAVAVAFDSNGVIQHQVSLIGFPSSAQAQSNSEAGTTFARPFTGDDDPDRPLVQARSTQILSLGRLAGAKRYDITVCAQTNSRSGSCSNDPTAGGVAAPKPAPANSGSSVDQSKTNSSNTASNQSQPTQATTPNGPTASETWSILNTDRAIARNTIVVHEKRYLGVRAGFGAGVFGGPVRTVTTTPGTAQFYVRERKWTTDYGLPLLLTWYPCGRDAVDGPPRQSFGVVAGIDILKGTSTPPVYLGATYDLSGFGITAGFAAERIESVNAANGTYLSSSAEGTKQSEWHPGGFLALTTDLDIFMAVFRNAFSTAKFPLVNSQ